MKKIITTLALVSSLALTGIASAQSIVPTGTGATSTNTTGTTGTMGTGTTGTGMTGTGTTGSGMTNSGSGTTVGVPNTGSGGDAPMNVAILVISAAAAVAAGAYALRSRKSL